ncbi:cypmaclein-like [Spinacia oleracea]|uniref:Cypmaclein-like n=1 Tax=Spinacia oleracea TaxID=3562 RepID=A0A9R0I5F1_SPIOL|nr:cypmaclein-like [Spinacia oleracea]
MMLNFNRIIFLAIAIFCLVLSQEWEVCNATNRHHLSIPPVHGVFLGAQIDCKKRCHERCGLASRYRRCLRACNTCCQRCNCVPPGTSGNADTCPCWVTMTTKSGRKKCP